MENKNSFCKAPPFLSSFLLPHGELCSSIYLTNINPFSTQITQTFISNDLHKISYIYFCGFMLIMRYLSQVNNFLHFVCGTDRYTSGSSVPWHRAAAIWMMTLSLSAMTTPQRVITYWMGCTGNQITSSPCRRCLRAMAWHNAAPTDRGTA